MFHDINQILSLIKKFRTAIDRTLENDDSIDDVSFCHFSAGCCGLTYYLLAQHLNEKGIGSLYVCEVRLCS